MALDRDTVPSQASIPIAHLAADEVSGLQRLTFPNQKDFYRAWDIGVFYLRTPGNLGLDAARTFGKELIEPDSVHRQIPQYGELEGFIALENNQQTKLALSRRRWGQHYPPAICDFGRQLDEIGMIIMREVLRESGIPETLWDIASGGYASGAGDAFLNFVHYDTRYPDLGLRPHTDYGFVTILDASAPGLQVEVDGQFIDVPAISDHLVINFGEALNFITRHSHRSVGAVVHRVLSQLPKDPVRHSIVYFANPVLDGMLWQFDASGEKKGESSVKDLFAQLEKDLTE